MNEEKKEVRATTYFAVELLPRMTPHEVAEALIRGGKTTGQWYRRLDSLGVIEAAGRKFARFRTDLEDLMPLLQLMLNNNQAVIYPVKGGFEAQFPVRKGWVSGVMLLGASEDNGRTYKGPKIKGWQEAFEPKQSG